MIIEQLDINSFRNYQNLHIRFDKQLNFIFGDNAQGKTNLLEAIYILCLARSFRSKDDSELIPLGEEQYILDGKFCNSNGIKRHVGISYSHSRKKSLKVDSKRITQFSKFIGQFPVVVLSSNDFDITNGPPAVRRRFFNILLSQTSAKYINYLKNYERILKQRNFILLNLLVKKIPEAELQVWDDQLVEIGQQIMIYRYNLVNELNEYIQIYYSKIANSDNKLIIEYEPDVSFSNCKDISKNFNEKIFKLRHKEKKRGTTLSGPHRDEFVFKINDKEVRKFGSRGEHKSTLISLKAAEAYLIQQKSEMFPILLLDDLYAELDKNRGKSVLDLFDKNCQIFITATSHDFEAVKGYYKNIKEKSTFFIQSGSVKIE